MGYGTSKKKNESLLSAYMLNEMGISSRWAMSSYRRWSWSCKVCFPPFPTSMWKMLTLRIRTWWNFFLLYSSKRGHGSLKWAKSWGWSSHWIWIEMKLLEKPHHEILGEVLWISRLWIEGRLTEKRRWFCIAFCFSATRMNSVDLVLAFWDGIFRGTKCVIDSCKSRGSPIKVFVLTKWNGTLHFQWW